MKRKERSLNLSYMFKVLLDLRKEMIRIDKKGIHADPRTLSKYQTTMEFLVSVLWFEAYYVDRKRLKDSALGYG